MRSNISGKDVFLWLPTGFEKSICYDTLPFFFSTTSTGIVELVVVVA